jgi:hypothetical protein
MMPTWSPNNALFCVTDRGKGWWNIHAQARYLTAVTMLLHCCYTAVTPLLHCCCTAGTLLIYCSYTVAHCCYTAVTPPSHRCNTVALQALSPKGGLRSVLPAEGCEFGSPAWSFGLALLCAACCLVSAAWCLLHANCCVLSAARYLLSAVCCLRSALPVGASVMFSSPLCTVPYIYIR